jgi:hypothetical protein
MVILAGQVAVTEHGYFDDAKPILIHGPACHSSTLKLNLGSR